LKKYERKIHAWVCVLLCIILLSACQPTPSTPPLVSRGQGLSEEFIAPVLAEGEFRQIDAPVRWEEEYIIRDGMLKIYADAEIKCPQVGNIPVIELQQKDFSNDELRRLTGYFAKDNMLYRIPPLTKERLTIELERIKAKDGDYALPFWSIDSFELPMNELIEQAPEYTKKEYINAFSDIQFDYPAKDEREYVSSRSDDETIEAQNSFKAFIEKNGIAARITATNYNTKVGSTSCFTYIDGCVVSESDMEEEQEILNTYSSYESEYLKSFVSDKWLKEKTAWLTKIQGIMNAETISIDLAQEQAEKVLVDLGINDMGLASIEKGIVFMSDDYTFFRWDNMNPDINNNPVTTGYLFTYYRKAGELLAISYGSRPFLNSPTFESESVTVFVTEKGVQRFEWYNMAQAINVIAENTKLLPFDILKTRVMDYYSFLAQTDFGHEFHIRDVELRLANTTAFNAPDRTWLIPVWCIENRHLTFDATSKSWRFDEMRMFNAITGEFIPVRMDADGNPEMY